MKTVSSELLTRSTCPNCWHTFEVEDVKWISAHEELLGDVRLGNDHQLRFRPTRFDVHGNAIDIQGISCQELACPHCHLKIPRSVLVFRPFFVSIAGTPSCGKSFLLASMTWQMRQALPGSFNIQFSDSDGECNKILNNYEDQLFFASGNERFTKLAKTDVVGDWYSTVQYDEQSVSYPKPFYFDLRPNADHINADTARRVSRLLCVYDNAGESFLPGADTVSSPVTRHLGLAESWIFCFDPTQDPRVRKALNDSNDHQIVDGAVTSRQESVLNEMVNRIRKHGNLGLKERSDKPLIICCTKYDAWSELIGDLPDPWTYSKSQKSCLLNLTNIEQVSTELKTILQKFCPELVAASQSISNKVYFVPVSATGVSPTKDPETDDYMIPTHQIDPIWCEVPLLLALAYRAPKLVKSGRSNSKTKSKS